MLGWFSAAMGPSFALEAFAETIRQNLDGDVALQPGVVGSVDFTHAAFAERAGDFVRSEFGADRKSPGS